MNVYKVGALRTVLLHCRKKSLFSFCCKSCSRWHKKVYGKSSTTLQQPAFSQHFFCWRLLMKVYSVFIPRQNMRGEHWRVCVRPLPQQCYLPGPRNDTTHILFIDPEMDSLVGKMVRLCTQMGVLCSEPPTHLAWQLSGFEPRYLTKNQ